LQLAQEAQEFGDFGGAVLIEAVEPNQGIEQEQAGPKVGQGGLQPLLVVGEVKAKHLTSDGIKWQYLDLEIAMAADGVDPCANRG
jgi:3-methyladenine DNA glycosylase Mpg